MGYISATAPCIHCKRLFSFNPLRVPSVVVNGSREPLCRDCVEWANQIRARRGLPLFTVFEDSYEAIDEREMVW